MAAEKVFYKASERIRDLLATETPWIDHIYVVRYVDFTVNTPADEGGTCDDGKAPRPDEEVRSAIFIGKSDERYAGTLYETYRWPGSSKFKLGVTRYANLESHTHMSTDAPVGFIWKKDAEHLLDIVKSIPTPDPSAIYAPGNLPDGSDLPPQDSIEWVTSVTKALRTRGMLIEKKPTDWYIDESGVFHERGRAEAGVGKTTRVGTSTLVAPRTGQN
ncbi:uncharacterized protein NECHADRAFT_75040 [Fusarium vanettenii 77-13-4]|uniref:Uncharacterized protein n=1 Tax=Fusarium vanettenii (strain ATCC MYA-4622 / CBS 123669 / FGSC 9596 / NRRL 45880 / 77-13-4) TaxID=660122 RepID=C7YHP2_FUSV7|nr:uncharacterized protein NECHADRAFT_75040 [Fusarium vanettenii 77-13-4]EEU47946.1 hypothetical protein NECHADRAFT_75040 [Fusarium vanettenii 77-13-4]